MLIEGVPAKTIYHAAFLEIAISDLYPCGINWTKAIFYNELFISCCNQTSEIVINIYLSS